MHKLTGYTGCASNLCSPNQPEAEEIQFTLTPVPERHTPDIIPESGFEARYEYVSSF
jgi:hypothetical protein